MADLARQLEEKQLMERVKAKDIAAFDILYNRYKSRILNYIYRFLGNFHMAEEVAQEAFVKFYTRAYIYDAGKAAVSTWFYRIAANMAKNRLRYEKIRRGASLDEPLIIDENAVSIFEAVPDRQQGADLLLRQQEVSQAIQKALDCLAPKYREAFILCDMQDMPYNEAAEILGCPEGSVASRLNRAREKMAQLLRLKFKVHSHLV